MEIKFNDVSFSYNEKTSLKKVVLNNININFKKQKINGIIGKSGSGKTTLVELINALIIPSKGVVEVDDYIIERNRKIININDLRFNIGLVFEYPEEQFFNTTVKKEIEFGLHYFKYKTDQIDKRASDALKMVGLDDSYLIRNPFSLSSGEKRKVAIASVLAFNPKVIILDEPTIGLDSSSKDHLIKLIKRMKNKYHKTIIIVSHDMDMIHKIVDYIYVINNKTVVMEGNKYEVFKREEQLIGYGLNAPKLIQFSNKVLANKKIKMGYRDDINDLIKDIYRYVK